MEDKLGNPFNVVKANDFTDQQIKDYWVDIPGGDGFLEVVDPTEPMPIMLVGGKGSGKTHLMRYFSYPLQKIRHDNVFDGVMSDGFLGIYLRCGSVNSDRFWGKSVPNDIWARVFPYYFEIWLAQVFLEVAGDFLKESGVKVDEAELCEELLGCFDKVPDATIECLDDFLDFLVSQQKAVDYAVNNCVFDGKLDVDILVSPGGLFFGLPKVLEKKIEVFKGLTFVYLIDELENLLEEQQVYIQTLIRDRQFPCTIRVGVRNYGIKTFRTLADGEENREGSELTIVRLDRTLRDWKKEQYKEFAINLCLRRLVEAGVCPDGKGVDKEDFYRFFETIPSISGLDDMDGITSGVKGKTLKKLTSYLSKYKSRIIESGFSDADALKKIPALLSFPRRPLLERAAVYQFYKAWNSSKNLYSAAVEINGACNRYIEDPSSEPGIAGVLDKFKTDLVAQLRKDNGQKQLYAGVDILVELSRGFPRSLLTIFKHIYQYSKFNGESPFVEGLISIESQVEGVKRSSSWYFEDSRIAGKDGATLKVAIERLAELFRINRYSDKPSECSLRAFSVNLSDVTEETRRLIHLASLWSLLIPASEGRPDKNSLRVDDKYSLNPMLSPHWGLPVGVRGVIVFKGDVLNPVFDKEFADDFSAVKGNFEKARSVPFKLRGAGGGPRQTQLGLDV